MDRFEHGRAAGRRVLFSLALRLYLLLMVIFLPTFFAVYFYSVRTVDALHDQEIDDLVRMSAVRLEDWLEGYPALADISPGDLARLQRELKRVADEPNGVESVTLFHLGNELPLTQLVAFGSFAPKHPTSDDLESVRTGVTRKVEIRRGEKSLLAVSVPLRHGNAVHGVIHMALQPDKVGLGRRLTHLRGTLILGALGVMAALGVGVVIFFTVAVNRPIAQLTGAMERAAEGNLSALVDIQGGELGWLATSYNQMMRRLKSSMDENRSLIEQIRGFNEELKAKIEAATREVATKNSQLQGANDRLFVLQGQMTTLEKLATLGQISAIIAHELGTPLNAISGHLQLLMAEPSTDRAAADRLRVIDAQVDRLTSIVRDVLKAMRVPPPRLHEVDLREVARQVVELIAPVAEKRGISVELDAAETLPILRADADQLQQVFTNLFTNSMDAMRGGGRLRISSKVVTEGAPGPGAWVRVEVEDSGQGMDEETLKRAFEPFYTTQGSEPISGIGARVGLGLSICRQIALAHGGEIKARSKLGVGTTFTLFLPVEPSVSRLS